MERFSRHFSAAVAAAMLAACGSDSTTSTPSASTAHGTLAQSPPFRIASVNAATFAAQIGASSSGAQLLQVTGAPTCGVDFYDMQFWTVGGAGEITMSSSALMVPTGSSAPCTGPRPILLYAHGTQTDQAANMADPTNPNNSEGVLIAAMFAAQGYIVVAPNYAGYDISTLGYHPYLNAAQNSGEMIDALTAARAALPDTLTSSTSDNGKLFISGYSEGGYVAMATQRALELAGKTVTAAVPMSGPYALEAFGDAIFFGNVNIGSTIFAPLITTSYQKAYGNLYTATSQIYSATYAANIATLLPSTTPLDTLFAEGQLPETALFDITTPTPANTTSCAEPLPGALQGALAVPANPLFASGFGNPYLINNCVRVYYALDAASDPDGATLGTSAALAAATPMYPLRKDLNLNDLRNGGWAPSAPTLMCGGFNDPTVYFSANAEVMASYWTALPPGLVTLLDIDPPGGPSGPFAAIQAAFQGTRQQELAGLEASGLTAAQAEAQLIQGYHASEAPFCALAARGFFSQF